MLGAEKDCGSVHMKAGRRKQARGDSGKGEETTKGGGLQDLCSALCYALLS